jgi:hypothetical protein
MLDKNWALTWAKFLLNFPHVPEDSAEQIVDCIVISKELGAEVTVGRMKDED